MDSVSEAPDQSVATWKLGPDAPGWAIDMVWKDLLFMHWPVDATHLQSLLPSGLEVDTHAGRAWVGLVPFTMDRVRLKGLPRVPGFTRFHECNVRTYVRCNGVPGVWFFSLDAANPVAVWTARLVWKLNYIFARFRVRTDNGLCTYEVRRPRGVRSRMQWRVGEPLPPTEPGSLEHFLTERYCLYSASRGRVWRGMVRHEPWTLCRAEVPELDDELVRAAGLEVEGPPLCHAAQPLHVHGWPIKRIR